VMVLVVFFMVAGSSASFIWFMNQQQTRAGTRLRAMAALALAEGCVHQALAILETKAPDGSPGRRWRPTAHSEVRTVGTFEGRATVSVHDAPDGAVLITCAGEIAGVLRRLRARVYLASAALLAGLYGAGWIRIEDPPASTVIDVYGIGPTRHPWVHIAVGRGLWFATANVALNDSSTAIGALPGPLGQVAPSQPSPGRASPVRLLMTHEAGLAILSGRLHVDVQQLRTLGVHLDGTVMRTKVLPPVPEVNRWYYQRLAAANTANADLNKAVGEYFGDTDLARKRDSLYSSREFELLQMFLARGLRSPVLRGVVYLRGGLGLTDGQSLQIQEGTLVAERAVYVDEGASFEVVHSQATRTLPGLIVLEPGGLIVRQRGRLRAHGLVHVEGIVNIAGGARMEVVGAVLAKDPHLSFLNAASTVLVLYDPAVLGTPGLRVAEGTPLVAWVAALEELP